MIFYFNKSGEVGNSGKWMDLDMGNFFNILNIAEIVGKYLLLALAQLFMLLYENVSRKESCSIIGSSLHHSLLGCSHCLLLQLSG